MVKIRSITDVVTNSSSEVFILQRDDALELERNYPFVDITDLTLDYLENNSWLSELYSWAAKIINNDNDSEIPYLDENEDPDRWKEIIKRYRSVFKKLSDEYVKVKIEDCYEGWRDATDWAESSCISSKNLH